MSVETRLPLPTEVDRLVRVPMAFEDYVALPEWHRAEYVDGYAIVSPSAIASPQRVSRRLANVVEAGCPGLFVVEAVGVRTGERRSRIPDVHATERPFDGSWSDQVPVLVAEILSPSTRREDTLRKSTEYLDAGFGQYWIVDREHRTLTVLVAAAGGTSSSSWTTTGRAGPSRSARPVCTAPSRSTSRHCSRPEVRQPGTRAPGARPAPPDRGRRRVAAAVE